MRKLILVLASVLVSALAPGAALFGQNIFSKTASHIIYGSSLPTTCKPSTGDVFFKTSATIGPYYCSTTNTWTALTAGGGGGAPTDATYITQTANGSLSAEQALSALSTGIMRVATTTGVITSLTDSAGIAANISDETGSGALVFGTSPTFVTPILGTPTSGTLTNATGLPISTGVSGLGTGVATFLGTPSSANLIAAVTDETGTGALVFATSPTLVTPALGTPASGVLTNATGLPISTGVSGLGTGVATFLGTPSSANLAAAITNETGSGALVFATSPALVTPDLGTPSAGVLTNATGLPISTGVSGLGTGVATFLGTPSSANLIAAVTNETGTGALVFANTPTLVTPEIGAATGTSLVLTGALTAPSGVTTGSSPPSLTSGTGGADAYAEGTAPSVCAAANVDCLYADSTQHGFMASRNNGSYLPIPQGPASTTSGNVTSWNATNGGLLSDAGFLATNVVRKDAANTAAAAMTLDMSGATGAAAFRVANIAGAAPATAGVISYDTTNKNLHVGANSVDTIAGLFLASALPADTDCIKASVASSVVRLASAGSACGAGSGTAGAPLFTQTAAVTVTATSETTLLGAGNGSLTIPANWFTAAGNSLIVESYGRLSTTTVPGTQRIRLKFGSTVILDTTAYSLVGSITNAVYRMRTIITARTVGASGTLIAQSIFETTGTALIPNEAKMLNTSTITVDTTATQVVDFTNLFDTASNSISDDIFVMYGPGSAVSSVFGLTGAVGNLAGDVSSSGVTTTIGAAKVAPSMMKASTFDAQTDAATITWAIASVLSAQASVTLGGNRTLNITNPVIGGNYLFKITQDGTGSRTLTKGTGCTFKELGSSAATFGLSTTASAVDILTFTYDGTNCYANIGKDYK